ncbi:MAG: Gfo/Idh/MocA family oxidoreductase [Acidobacteriia bacterium]|nr:Gfo/Idh/MocA family oxidoreductase [Terriglobia bacterium]
MQKVRWGILGVARIATVKVIPAMQRGELCEITGIASRDRGKAEEAARRLGIPRAYGSYEEMLADPQIEAVYNPLPNHFHVPWSIRAAEAGKHVLCEKPIALSAAEALQLIAARDRTGVTIGEAFMVQTHPQWVRTMDLVRSGRIGQLRFAMGSFGYFNRAPENIRNIREYGGGGLMDIGCYPIKTSRMVFGEEPTRVSGTLVPDPSFGVDILASAILDYPSGQCVFACSTQVVPHQSMQFFGTTGRIELEIPFNAVPNRTSRIRIDDGSDILGSGIKVEEFAPCDQYTIQGDLFSRAVRGGGAPSVPLEDSVKNMAVIDAIFRSAKSGKWEAPEAVLEAATG